jgi:hypothetical protein
MVSYWSEIVKVAFWKSLLVFFDDPIKGIGLFILGSVVTTVIVWIVRSKDAFTEHLKSNIAIVIAGGICTWLLVFAYCLVIGPPSRSQELTNRLGRVEADMRSAVISREGSEMKVQHLEQIPIVKILHGACKATEEQINPLRTQQVCSGGGTPTFRDRILAVNAHLTEGDRNRFSDALSEFDNSITQASAIGIKIRDEGIVLDREQANGAIVTDVDAQEKKLSDVTAEGQKYYKDFPAMRYKWQSLFEQQTEYVFGDNPDNHGSGYLIAAPESYRNFLENWKHIQNKGDKSVLNLLYVPHDEYQGYLKSFTDWNDGCRKRLAEMRDSIR